MINFNPMFIPSNKVLFICKAQSYFSESQQYSYSKYSGLRLSATLCSQALCATGTESKVVVVQDNNDIDREVAQYKPTHVIIEALWVVPEKFDILQRLHPEVKWIIRLHSETPFLAMEGSALSWVLEYVKYDNVVVSPNSKQLTKTLIRLIKSRTTLSLHHIRKSIVYLPNCYRLDESAYNEILPDFADVPEPYVFKTCHSIDIGCFGAVRPLKNQLQQAIAAVEFADKIHKNLRFHINASRIEQSGNSVLKNIRAIFKDHPRHVLVEHDWLQPKHFLTLLSQMDLGMQVSYTETFNIVTADMVSSGVPVVVSPEVHWTANFSQCNPNSVESIVECLEFAYGTKRWGFPRVNQWLLNRWTRKSISIWVNYFGV